jgi:hypothetical protein
MTIGDLGSVGEFIGAIAVLVTLIYLAAQLKQNTQAIRAQISQARSDQAQEFFLFSAGSDHIAEIWAKVQVDHVPDPAKLEELDDVERSRLLFYCVANQQRLENMYFQHKRGFLNDETYKRTLLPISRQIPLWNALGIMRFKEGEFAREVQRIAREEGPDSNGLTP